MRTEQERCPHGAGTGSPVARFVACRASRSHAFSGKEKAWLLFTVCGLIAGGQDVVGAPLLVSSRTLWRFSRHPLSSLTPLSP